MKAIHLLKMMRPYTFGKLFAYEFINGDISDTEVVTFENVMLLKTLDEDEYTHGSCFHSIEMNIQSGTFVINKTVDECSKTFVLDN